MNEILKYVMVAVKGVLMGAANVVPGVSGGTIALMTGIYGRLVHSISSFDATAVKLFFTGKFRAFFKHIDGWFLLSVVIGISTGTELLAGLMTSLLAGYPIQTWAFFFGLIVASAIFMLLDVHGWRSLDGLFLALGIAIGAVLCSLTPAQTPDALWFVFVSGAICVCAMILPGISGSFLLLLLGKYAYVFGALGDIVSGHGGWNEWAIVVAFGVGAVIGILAFSKLLDRLMKKWSRRTMLVLAGFLLGSLVKVWPWNNVEPGSEPHVVWALVFAIVGFAVVFLVEFLFREGGSSSGDSSPELSSDVDSSSNDPSDGSIDK
ncbi:MAG: DUF368 domain-containing protein [Bacteroidales bacterium]|nr:DUF368 domain-containing protein [Bacteroidales bacterium]